MKDKIIINIGFNRTATTSLLNALQILGYVGIHDPWHKGIDIFWNNMKNNKKLLDGLVDKYNAFLDHPFLQMGVLSLFIEQYPNAYFIYTKRNHKDRYKSEGLPWGEKHWIRWEKHAEEIIDYILKRNPHIKVLEFNVCDKGHGWNELCKFLNDNIPDINFPHLNKRKL